MKNGVVNSRSTIKSVHRDIMLTKICTGLTWTNIADKIRNHCPCCTSGGSIAPARNSPVADLPVADSTSTYQATFRTRKVQPAGTGSPPANRNCIRKRLIRATTPFDFPTAQSCLFVPHPLPTRCIHAHMPQSCDLASTTATLSHETPARNDPLAHRHEIADVRRLPVPAHRQQGPFHLPRRSAACDAGPEYPIQHSQRRKIQPPKRTSEHLHSSRARHGHREPRKILRRMRETPKSARDLERQADPPEPQA